MFIICGKVIYFSVKTLYFCHEAFLPAATCRRSEDGRACFSSLAYGAMKVLLKIVLWAAAVLAAAFAVFLSVGAITDFRPEARETVEVRETVCENPSASAVIPDSLKVVTWNIGYGGLGDDMDFFYDGGTRMRCSEERTRENLAGIIDELKSMDADIYLLQEVDECSRRTYRINELELLQEAFPGYRLYFAYNYKSFFVPVPVREPLGKVASGVAILSRYLPEKVERLAYPSRFPFPVSMFNLKRCLLAAEYRLADGIRLVIGNTHNTAYDTGDMRTQETDFLARWADSLASAGVKVLVGGDWNQYPEGYVPSAEETDNPYFVVEPLGMSVLDVSGRVEYDKEEKTLRYLDKPFGEGSVRSVTDYFFISVGTETGPAMVCGNDGFRHGDHRPVAIDVFL